MDNCQKKPLVSICCITYNHAPYIRQCIDGMLMQKTDFSFEIIINDDCSTDGTTEIIQEYVAKYPNIIHPIFHEENQYSKGVRGLFAKFVFPKAQGKYFAMCEGDDYWTDQLKLQKQVDILEKDSRVQLVYTSFNTINKNGILTQYRNFEYCKKISKSGDAFAMLLERNFIMTLTCCIRKEVLVSAIYINTPVKYDYSLFLAAAAQGNLSYIEEVTGIYRRLDTGLILSHSDKISKYAVDVFLYYVELYLNNKLKHFSFSDRLIIDSIIVYKTFKIWLSNSEKRTVLFLFKKHLRLWLMIPFALIYGMVAKMKYSSFIKKTK